MTKSTITRERIQRIIRAIDSEAYDEEEIREWLSSDEIMELSRMALAAMDSEPVVWLNGCNKSVPAALRYLAENPRPIGGESSFNTAHLYQLAREIELMAEGTLYRHAQPEPVVPEEKPIPNTLSMYSVDAVAAIAEVKGWNACRAAMLHPLHTIKAASALGSLPKTGEVLHTNYPVIPDRWIPVSERMPEERMSVILWDAEIGEVTSGHYSHKTQTFYHCGDAIENEITHWMAVPAPQEVKSE